MVINQSITVCSFSVDIAFSKWGIATKVYKRVNFKDLSFYQSLHAILFSTHFLIVVLHKLQVHVNMKILKKKKKRKKKKKKSWKKGYNVIMKAVEIEARGSVAGTLYQFPSQIRIKGRNRAKCIKRLIEIMENSSRWIWNKNIPWNNSKISPLNRHLIANA